MQSYDVVMLVILAFATLNGYRKGLAWQVASIASIGISYYVAYRFRERLAVHIAMEDPWRTLVAMLVLYVASSLAIWFIFQNTKGIIERAKLKDFDQQLGAIFGLVKGAVLCVVITLFAVSLLQPGMSQHIVNSRSGGYIARLLDKSHTLIPHELHQVLAPYLKQAEDRFNQRSVTSISPPQPVATEQPMGAAQPKGTDPLKNLNRGMDWILSTADWRIPSGDVD